MTTGRKTDRRRCGRRAFNRLAVLLAPAKQHIGIDLMPTCHAVDRLALDISLGNDARFSSSLQRRRASPRMICIPPPTTPSLKTHH